VYYRWTGCIGGKRTTKTIQREAALECQRRIKKLRNLQKKMKKLLRESLAHAPWASGAAKPRGRRKRRLLVGN
jgi:hypothetical protein